MSKTLLAYHSKYGDFLHWLTTRLSQMSGLYILLAQHLYGHTSPKRMHTTTLSAKQMQSSSLHHVSSQPQISAIETVSPNQSDNEIIIGISTINSRQSSSEESSTQPEPFLKAKRIALELYRLLQFVQNYLFSAPKDIKVTLSSVQSDNAIPVFFFCAKKKKKKKLNKYVCMHIVLKICINMSSHCNEGKHALLSGEMRKNVDKKKRLANGHSFLYSVMREAFASSTEYSTYHLCFDLLQSMILYSEGIHCLITKFDSRLWTSTLQWNKMHTTRHSKNLLENCVALIQYSQKKSTLQQKRLCCIKLLCNLALTDLGQNVIANHFCNISLFAMCSMFLFL
ncbi:hypothetical protein RFI_06087 [Reticulomyxa filosa]|uniref:Uncharacterized protein n=1 Tax=Reticulomyxa filosa TaxID=46433 RepID=X6NYR6_RETFI|nr:hypothetical protein RFI_06087 [Reticulomyxa filosa]|eukprot:ETO31033.1 hypothetical protein RFI_06087 [Reticulomyxa filosa]